MATRKITQLRSISSAEDMAEHNEIFQSISNAALYHEGQQHIVNYTTGELLKNISAHHRKRIRAIHGLDNPDKVVKSRNAQALDGFWKRFREALKVQMKELSRSPVEKTRLKNKHARPSHSKTGARDYSVFKQSPGPSRDSHNKMVSFGDIPTDYNEPPSMRTPANGYGSAMRTPGKSTTGKSTALKSTPGTIMYTPKTKAEKQKAWLKQEEDKIFAIQHQTYRTNLKETNTLHMSAFKDQLNGLPGYVPTFSSDEEDSPIGRFTLAPVNPFPPMAAGRAGMLSPDRKLPAAAFPLAAAATVASDDESVGGLSPYRKLPAAAFHWQRRRRQ